MFYVGDACSFGHDGLRYANGFACVQCARSRATAAYAPIGRKPPRTQQETTAQKTTWARLNRDQVNAGKRVRHAMRMRSDQMYATTRRVRNRTAAAFRLGGYSKRPLTKIVLGCDWETLKAHIEERFAPGMSWDNRREWHIDHIRPLASAMTEDDLVALCHYTNLQPLWALDNLSKGSKHHWKGRSK